MNEVPDGNHCRGYPRKSNENPITVGRSVLRFSVIRIVSIVYLCFRSLWLIPERMIDGGKRTIQVNVKMSEEDYKLLQAAASALWPEAILSNSGILLGLARIAAKDILGKSPKAKVAAKKGR